MEASSFVSTIVATLVVAVPIALLVSLALLRIYRRAVIRSMQQRVTLGAAPGLMGALENMPARSDDRARAWLRGVRQRSPDLFAHWALRYTT